MSAVPPTSDAFGEGVERINDVLGWCKEAGNIRAIRSGPGPAIPPTRPSVGERAQHAGGDRRCHDPQLDPHLLYRPWAPVGVRDLVPSISGRESSGSPLRLTD